MDFGIGLAVAANYGKLGLDERPRRLPPTRANGLPARIAA
jgi:hypothetical protein